MINVCFKKDLEVSLNQNMFILTIFTIFVPGKNFAGNYGFTLKKIESVVVVVVVIVVVVVVVVQKST